MKRWMEWGFDDIAGISISLMMTYLHEIRTEAMNESTKGKAVSPASGHISYGDSLVAISLLLCPKFQCPSPTLLPTARHPVGSSESLKKQKIRNQATSLSHSAKTELITGKVKARKRSLEITWEREDKRFLLGRKKRWAIGLNGGVQKMRS